MEDVFMDMICVKDLDLQYKTDSCINKILDGVSLTIGKGLTAITGPSGSGKSSILHILGGLKRPTSGQVVVNGTNIIDFSDEDLAIFRRRNIGFVFRQNNLIPILNVYENIVFPMALDSRDIEFEYILQIAKLLKIEDKLFYFPKALSSGERQRVSIARALSTKPAVILADEPTGNLDSRNAIDVIGLLKLTCKEFNQTIILVSHDKEIAGMADQIIHFKDGKIKYIEKRRKDYADREK